MIHNNHDFLKYKSAYERLLIALNCYEGIPYFSQLCELDARFNEIDRMSDLINKEIIKVDSDIAFDMLAAIIRIIFGVNMVNINSAYDIMEGTNKNLYNYKNLQFNSEKLFKFYEKVVNNSELSDYSKKILRYNNPETLKEAQETVDTKLKKLEKQAEQLVDIFMQGARRSSAIIKTSNRSKQDWKNNINPDFTTADKVQFIFRYNDNHGNYLAQRDCIFQKIVENEMLRNKPKQRSRIVIRNKTETEKE